MSSAIHSRIAVGMLVCRPKVRLARPAGWNRAARSAGVCGWSRSWQDQFAVTDAEIVEASLASVTAGEIRFREQAMFRCGCYGQVAFRAPTWVLYKVKDPTHCISRDEIGHHVGDLVECGAGEPAWRIDPLANGL